MAEQPDILGKAVRRLETEKRRKIDAPNPEIDVAGRRLRPRLAPSSERALRLGVYARPPHLRVKAQRRAPSAACRPLKL